MHACYSYFRKKKQMMHANSTQDCFSWFFANKFWMW